MADDEYKLLIDYRPKGSGFGETRFSGIEKLNNMRRAKKMSEERAEYRTSPPAERICSVCEIPISPDGFIARGMCRKCYKKWYRAESNMSVKQYIDKKTNKAPKTAEREEVPVQEPTIDSSGNRARTVASPGGNWGGFEVVINFLNEKEAREFLGDLIDNLGDYVPTVRMNLRKAEKDETTQA